jgi:dTMP kinase
VTEGVLIVLEGIDGSGKTTLARRLAQSLRDAGRTVVETREPTDGPYGRRIREIAASGRDGVTAEQELDLFMKDRAEHVAGVVRPALALGKVVVQDRSYFSTVAYQGERGLDRDRLLAMGRSVAPTPDVLLVVDVPAEVAVERIQSSRGFTDDFEAVAALKTIRSVFLGFSEARVVDATADSDVTLARALVAVRAAVPKLGPQ